MIKHTKTKIIIVLILLIVSIVGGSIVSSFIVFSLSGIPISFLPATVINAMTADSRHLLLFLLLSAGCFIALSFTVFWRRSVTPAVVDMVKLTPEIAVPIAAGQKQHGSARFTSVDEQKKFFHTEIFEPGNPLLHELLNEGAKDKEAAQNGEILEVKPLPDKIMQSKQTAGGIPVSYEKSGHREFIGTITGDVHTITYGTTRCGKTRTLVIQSICMQALGGMDVLNVDPKGELFNYSSPFLCRLGYQLYPVDFKNPQKSVHINFLQFIIDALNEKNVSKAIQCCWDFVDTLVVKATHAEPIWTDGEKALLTAAVMQVVFDNSPLGLASQYKGATDKEITELYVNEHKRYQNCTNLYNYISQMAKENPQTGKLLLADIIDVLPNNHPSKLIMSVAESAPDKMRGSFVTSALTTLRLFTDPNIAEMTSCTDWGLLDSDVKKAIFLIVPDAKTTYYPLVSLFVYQYYQFLAEAADKQGGRLIRKIALNLDEFGNFPKLPAFDVMLSVGAGRGILLNLYLQSPSQLTEKYGREKAAIILDNCHYTIYLKSGADTAKIISEKLGMYTVMATSSSASLNDNGGVSISVNNSGSSSSSTQLMSRHLLTPDEIGKIERPYLLILADNGYPSLTQSPDLHQWYFNQMLGLGTIEHNTRLRALREQARPAHEISELYLWDFLSYINNMLTRRGEAEKELTQQEYTQAIANNFADVV